MTRQEAIDAIVGAWGSGECCVGLEEEAEARAEMLEALEALGVERHEVRSEGLPQEPSRASPS